VLNDSKMDKGGINDVVLVGGSTRIPKVQQMLQVRLGEGWVLCVCVWGWGDGGGSAWVQQMLQMGQQHANKQQAPARAGDGRIRCSGTNWAALLSSSRPTAC
jgi:hypothetical protein